MAVFNRDEIIGNYRVQNLIKGNLYTETYRVVDSDSNPYFLKLFILSKLPGKLVSSTGIVKEIECSEGVSHRNIVGNIASGKIEKDDSSYQYYVTPYFNGQLLADKIAVSGKMEEAEALTIFQGILQGIAYLHSRTPALCHNDLDVSNIIISDVDKGQPVIIDLGHLSARSAGNVNFDTDDLDPFFHASETRVNIFDEAGDVFSACAILYTMLAGECPWKTDIHEGTFKERLTALTQYRKSHTLEIDSLGVSDKVRFILSKGLQIKSQDRIQSIGEILNILDGKEGEDQSIQKTESGSKANGRKTLSSNKDEEQEFEIRKGSGNGFKDIAGMHELKEQLRRQIIFVLQDKEMAERYRLSTPNGMLLYGPPGCGKTFFAEKFAEETGYNFILVKASDLGSTFVHGSQEKISRLFKIAEKNAPIVLCFDEFDAFVPDRSSHGAQYQAGEVNEFLSQMNNCSSRGIFIVATSNRPDKIDPAVQRTGRIDKKVYVPLPDLEARKEMFTLYLDKRPLSLDIDINSLAQRSEGYIASDIAYLVNDAAMMAAFAREPISMHHLNTSLDNTKPSLRKELLESYDRIRDMMEEQNRANNIRVIVNGL